MDIVNNAGNMLLVEEETGSLVDMIGQGDTVRIIRENQKAAKRRMDAETISFNSGRKFVKQFPDLSARLCERLSPNAVWLLNLLAPYVGMNSGIVRYRNGTFVKRTDIVKWCAATMSERTADRAVTELCERGVLAKCTVRNKKAFIMNPYVMQNGSRANATLLGLFKDTEWVNYGTART